MQEIRQALTSVRIEPDVAWCPVLEVPQRVTHHQLAQPPPQPPVYPGMDKSAAEQLGAAVMSHYT